MTAAWLDNSFLEKALRSSKNDESISVTSSEVSPATAPGDNFGSSMYRVKVEFRVKGQRHTRSFIVKAELPSEGETKATEETTFFQRERTALAKIAPQLQKMLKGVSSYAVQPFAAECIYVHFGESTNALILEDLKEKGFTMAEGTSGLDFNHCVLVLRSLARYHAASVVLYEKDSESFKPFTRKLYDQKTKNFMGSLYGKSLRSLAMEVEKWPENGQYYSNILRQISEIAIDHIVKCQERNTGGFNVLNHGDLWFNNLMFRYSQPSKEPKDIRFVDYQLGIFGDAALDLQYFLHTSPSIEVLHKQHILVEEYHRTLGETFTALGRKEYQPSLEQLKKQLDDKGLYAVIIGCVLFPAAQADGNERLEMMRQMQNEGTKKFTEKSLEAFKVLLPEFKRKGWLELQNFI